MQWGLCRGFIAIKDLSMVESTGFLVIFRVVGDQEYIIYGKIFLIFKTNV